MSFEFFIEQPLPAGIKVEHELVDKNFPHYMQLSNITMSLYLQVLNVMGVLDTDTQFEHSFDEPWDRLGFTPQKASWIAKYLKAVKEDLPFDEPHIPTQQDIDAFLQAQTESNALRDLVSPDKEKILAYKFLTTDGWLISSQECQVLYDTLAPETLDNQSLFLHQLAENTALTLDNLLSGLANWRAFIKLAIQYGGYRVY